MEHTSPSMSISQMSDRKMPATTAGRRKTSPADLVPPLTMLLDNILKKDPLVKQEAVGTLEDAAQALLKAHASLRQAKANLALIAKQVLRPVAERFCELVENSNDILLAACGHDRVHLVMWSDSTLPHAALHNTFAEVVRGGIHAKTGLKLVKRLMNLGSSICDTQWGPHEVGKEPDASLIHKELARDLPMGQQAGPLVLEGAVGNETYPILLNELLSWAKTDPVQVAVGVKVYLQTVEGVIQAPSMFITAVERMQDGFVVHAPLQFGSGSNCISEGLPDYQVLINLDMLFANTSDQGHPGTEGYLLFDLYDIRHSIFSCIKQEASNLGGIADDALRDHEEWTKDFAQRHDMRYEANSREHNNRRRTRSNNRENTRIQFGV